MAYHNGTEIIVASNPRGMFMEGTIKTGETPRPGVIVQQDVSAGLDDNGRPTFEVYNTAGDGDRPIGPLYILLPDPAINTWGLNTTAFPATTEEWYYSAYAAGAHCFVYTPAAGEEFNMLLQDVSGTGDTHSAGEELMPDDGTGTLIAATGEEICPFMLQKAVGVAPTGDFLAHVIYTGY